MRIGFYQFAPILGDVNDNVSRMVEVIKKARVDLLVMPELATSGYFFSNKEELLRASEPLDGGFIKKMIDASRESGVYVAVGIPEPITKGNEVIVYNSAVLFGPEGVVGIYRKVHLFDREKLYFNPGDIGFPIFEILGVKLGLLVCFDHMFPEAARTLALKGAQIICHPANLVLPGLAQLTTRVRAAENRVFWVLANRYGREEMEDKSLLYTGKSQIVAPDGRVLISAPEAEDMIGVVDIDPSLAKNKQITERNDIFADRKPEYYGL